MKRLLAAAALLVASLAPGLAQACSCMMTDAGTLIAQGHPIAQVTVTDVDRPADINGWVSMKATVVRSYTGDLPADEITLVTGGNSAMCGFPIEPGETTTVVLHPRVDDRDGIDADFSVSLCTSMVVNGADAQEALDQHAAQRAAAEGVWIDVVRFREVLNNRPTIAELEAAFPEINVVGPDEIATMEMRFDQSRFFADLNEDGRVIGGGFR